MYYLLLLNISLRNPNPDPGKTNKYLIATHDPLAILYNDASPLENMHASTLFQLLQDLQSLLLTPNACSTSHPGPTS